MPMTKRYIKQATIFDEIGTPKGYDSLTPMQKHRLRHEARRAYDIERDNGHNERFAAYTALERARSCTPFYIEQNRLAAIERRCGAWAKRSGRPCKMKPLPGRARCKYHGGMSTGPKSLAGKIKALSSLKQYKARPDLLEARIAKLRAESLNAGNHFETGDTTPNRLAVG